jgi:hypothetical protein
MAIAGVAFGSIVDYKFIFNKLLIKPILIEIKILTSSNLRFRKMRGLYCGILKSGAPNLGPQVKFSLSPHIFLAFLLHDNAFSHCCYAW